MRSSASHVAAALLLLSPLARALEPECGVHGRHDDAFFVEALERLPATIEPAGTSSTGLNLVDIDADGDLDLFVAEGTASLDTRPNELFINDGRGFFADESATRLPQGNDANSTSADFADVDADGDLDAIVANVGPEQLLLNDGSGHSKTAPTICRRANSQLQEAAMSHKYAGGCSHISTYSDKDPIDNHTCHCSVCKRVTGQASTHVVFFNHKDLQVENASALKRQPFNDQNPGGPLQLCTCGTCGTPILLDDTQRRIRVIVPNLMGYAATGLAPTYHAFFDPSKGEKKPSDGRPVYEGLRPEFIWPPST